MEIDGEASNNVIPHGVKGVKRFKADSTAADSQCNGDLEPTAPLHCLDTEEFQFPPADPQKFFKSGKFNTVDEIMEIITTTSSQKRDSLATAELCPSVKRPRLVINKGNIKTLYGWDQDQYTYLHPEEALYLIETGKLEVLTEGVPLSAERARLVFLDSVDSNPSGIPSCSAEEYIVYKHFTKLGYRVRRRLEHYPTCAGAPSENPTPADIQIPGPSTRRDEENLMEVNNESGTVSDVEETIEIQSTEDVQMLPSTSSFRGTKRRADQPPQGHGSESESSARNTETAAIVDDDSDCEFIETVEKESKWDMFVRVCDEMSIAEVPLDTQKSSQSESPGSCSPSSSPQPYVVAESDSDVEFVDEVLFSAVTIQEIPDEAESSFYCEPGPSSSKEAQVIVDLVSSDSEVDEAAEYEPIWSKCVPNTKIQLSFPPSCLLPQNIGPRDELRVYEYNLVNQDTSDLEIETIVDSLRIDVNVGSNVESTSASWKEWRQGAVAEAKDVLNASLIGKPTQESVNTTNKLHQWKPILDSNKAELKSKPKLHMPFDLFPPTAAQVNKHKLGVLVKPTHRLAIVRENEVIPDAVDFPSNEDEAPVLVTVIGEDSNIINLLCNATPIPSLF